MATEAFTIVSHYTSSSDETIQKEAVLSSELDALWESEAGPSNISLKRRIPPRFVPASNSYSLTDTENSSKPVSRTGNNDVASWYAGLSRSQTPSKQPEPSSRAISLSVRATPKLSASKPTKNDWFIHRAISNLPKDTAPVQKSSIADMLQQAPPSLENPIQPTVFLHIGPNNRGFGLLQRQGWEEGQPLGLSIGDTPATLVRSAPPTPPHEHSVTSNEIDEQTQPAGFTEATQVPSRTALITPLRTTLKVDKRGIGPRSKSMPKPAITHSLSDIRMAAERARRERDGRGKRGFARTARRDAEERSRLFQELK